MMLHRHFEKENNREGMTTLDDVTPKADYVSEVFPPEETDEAPRKRGRKKAEPKE